MPVRRLNHAVLFVRDVRASVTFYAEVPSAGDYRLYLQFQHGGKVHTAEFTAVAEGA